MQKGKEADFCVMNSKKGETKTFLGGFRASRRQEERIRELRDPNETLEGFFIGFCGSVNFELFHCSKGFDIKIV
jgi:hypothetical protein